MCTQQVMRTPVWGAGGGRGTEWTVGITKSWLDQRGQRSLGSSLPKSWFGPARSLSPC